MDATDRFVDAINRGDMDALEACLHPDFEMIVPQKPARGFKGREQEMKNMRYLAEAYPDFRITVIGKAVDGDKVWTESSAKADGLEMSAVVIWTIDAETDTLASGRYFSESVEHAAADIDAFMGSLGT